MKTLYSDVLNPSAGNSDTLGDSMAPTLWEPRSHWDNHPDYPTEDWTDEVCNGNTRQGYVDWVNNQIEQEFFSNSQSTAQR